MGNIGYIIILFYFMMVRAPCSVFSSPVRSAALVTDKEVRP